MHREHPGSKHVQLHPFRGKTAIFSDTGDGLCGHSVPMGRHPGVNMDEAQLGALGKLADPAEDLEVPIEIWNSGSKFECTRPVTACREWRGSAIRLLT